MRSRALLVLSARLPQAIYYYEKNKRATSTRRGRQASRQARERASTPARRSGGNTKKTFDAPYRQKLRKKTTSTHYYVYDKYPPFTAIIYYTLPPYEGGSVKTGTHP